MKIRKSSRLLACMCLLALTLLSGCGGSSSNTTIPTTTTIFFAHSAIFKNSTTMMTMGYNGFGQLGQGNLTNLAAATVVPNLGPVNGFSAGGDHTVAFAFSNLSSVYAWGSNYHGQIGSSITTTGTGAYSPRPIRVSIHDTPNPITTGLVTSVAAGAFHSLAVVDGTVYSWGYNGFGQLGAGRTLLSDNATPSHVSVDTLGAPLNNIQNVAAGGGHSLALSADGMIVYAWGNNAYGQLGSDPLQNTFNQTPMPVSGLLTDATHKILQIAAAGSNSYALIDDGTGKHQGTVWAWGFNGQGQLGKNPAVTAAVGSTPPVAATPFSFTPVKVMVNQTTALVATSIAAGLDHVLALAPDQTVWAWGLNEVGQLGNNPSITSTSVVYSYIPVQVRKNGIEGNLLTGVTDISAFGNSSLAKSLGVWYGWGDNGFGQIGNPVSNNSIGYLLIPAKVQGF